LRPGLARGRKGFSRRADASPEQGSRSASVGPGSPPPPARQAAAQAAVRVGPIFSSSPRASGERRPPRGRACASASSPGVGRSRSSVAETPPTTAVLTVGGSLRSIPQIARSTSLRRAAGGLYRRCLNISIQRRRYQCKVVAVEVVSQLDHAQAQRSRAQKSSGQHYKRLDQKESGGPVRSLDHPPRTHCD
jgi:hypothetical protein